jgi:hypothetical protein
MHVFNLSGVLEQMKYSPSAGLDVPLLRRDDL